MVSEKDTLLLMVGELYVKTRLYEVDLATIELAKKNLEEEVKELSEQIDDMDQTIEHWKSKVPKSTKTKKKVVRK